MVFSLLDYDVSMKDIFRAFEVEKKIFLLIFNFFDMETSSESLRDMDFFVPCPIRGAKPHD